MSRHAQPVRIRGKRAIRWITAATSFLLLIGGIGTGPAVAAPGDQVLIYGPSLYTGDGVVNERTLAEDSGAIVTVWGQTQWSEATTAQFGAFDAIVFGDPNCATDTSPLATAEANRAEWSPAVDGPMIVIGTDPIFHANIGTTAAATLTTNAIDFAASGSGTTGLYASLSCYYESAEPVGVTFLDQFGSFGVHGLNEDNVTIQDNGHPSMAGLTDENLSGWGNSVHEVFDTFPAAFGSLVAEATSGQPYIVATGVTPPAQRTLSVNVIGDGSGNVDSDPPGIDCPGIEGPCSNEFDDGTDVTLTATPDLGSDFAGWGGACAFAGTTPTCTLTMDANKSVTAEFAPESEGQADLSLTKSDAAPFGPDPVSSGGLVAYGVSVSNAGPSTATGVTVSDTPTGGTIESASGTGWSCTTSPASATCTRTSPLGPEESDSNLTMIVRAPNRATDGSMSDTAQVSSDVPDPSPGNNSDSEGTSIRGSGSAASRDQASTFYDGIHTATVQTKRDTAGGFYSKIVVPPGLSPGVVSIDERPASEFPTFCGGAACYKQVQISVLPAGQTSPNNPIHVFFFFPPPGEDRNEGRLYVKGDAESVASVVPNCIRKGIADPGKCLNGKKTLENRDVRWEMLWRDGGDPVGAKRR